MQSGRGSQLTPERIKKLDDLDFDWGVPGWDAMFEDLVKYSRTFGNCLVPTRDYVDNPAWIIRLGRWVKEQRVEFKRLKEGKDTRMTQDRIRRLETLNFIWDGKTAIHEEQWNAKYEQLQDYNRKFGHCLVPHDYSVNRSLGIWCATQRKQFRLFQAGEASNITQSRIDRLETLGFVWTRRVVKRV